MVQSCRGFEQVRLHVDSAQLRKTAAELEESLDAFQYTHMRESNFLDEFQFRMFGQSRDAFRDSKHGTDDVVRGVA